MAWICSNDNATKSLFLDEAAQACFDQYCLSYVWFIIDGNHSRNVEKIMSKFLIIISIVIVTSCSKSVEKPAVTIGHYSKQVVQINEVVKKLLNEPDVKVMRYMADGVEATRAIGCDAVGEECNAYYELINKIVDLTKDNDLSVADREILTKLDEKLQVELKKSEAKIQAQWKEYINSTDR